MFLEPSKEFQSGICPISKQLKNNPLFSFFPAELIGKKLYLCSSVKPRELKLVEIIRSSPVLHSYSPLVEHSNCVGNCHYSCQQKASWAGVPVLKEKEKIR